MKTLRELEMQRRVDFRMRIADEKLSLANWRESEADADVHDTYLIEQLAERLVVLLEFFGRAKTEKAAAIRVWCLLYALRPQLLNHESAQDAANRFKVSQQRVCELLKEFKSVTGFTYPDRTGKMSPERQRKCIEAMSAARSASALRRRLATFQKRELEAAR